ncbi:hypothetical protein LENED_006138 [Lentinula edodes]|uniref:Uncharacterized protein n=1 Tax=Lentinula edodes TaxID=5353 RepID=A0A1Q3EAU7_LENED|nr:hypothetical protein LENED_006138 [Lentinula edodes]
MRVYATPTGPATSLDTELRFGVWGVCAYSQLNPPSVLHDTDDEMSLPLKLFSILSWLSLVIADATNNTTAGVPNDPYLQYKPEFARSLPVQTLVTGVVFTLVAVLFVHIVFTGQYHWPLAPVNYALQLSGVVTLLVSLIATIHVIFSSAIHESQHWPYMLSYIAVNVPPLDMLNVAPDPDSDTPSSEITWSPAERGTWLMMNASVSALAQITHIQFLTLLYPSRLEGRLIYCLLAIMQLIPIQANTNLINIANNIRNVCNATLSLLFTASLFIWGLLVNRSQAWRTDGGTAVFGASALSLAMVSTALNFLYVPKNEEYVWLPGLIWAVILWQSFLGWWWWVGAGNGQSTEDAVEQVFRRGDKFWKKRRKAKSKKDNIKSTSQRGTDPECSDEHVASVSGRSSLSDDSTSHSRTISAGASAESPPVRRRARRARSSGSATSMSTEESITTLPRFLPQTVHAWYNNLRQAHVTAARRQTVERVERIREIERGRMDSSGEVPSGWGLGSFGWKVGRSQVAQYEMESNPRRRRRSDEREQRGTGSEDDFNNIHYPPSSSAKLNKQNTTTSPRHSTRVEDSRPKSIWWWGPLNRWRLQDSTTYH